MKRTTIASFLIALMGILAIGLAYAQSEKANQGMPDNYSSRWCPWCGSSMGERYGPGWGDHGASDTPIILNCGLPILSISRYVAETAIEAGEVGIQSHCRCIEKTKRP